MSFYGGLGFSQITDEGNLISSESDGFLDLSPKNTYEEISVNSPSLILGVEYEIYLEVLGPTIMLGFMLNSYAPIVMLNLGLTFGSQ